MKDRQYFMNAPNASTNIHKTPRLQLSAWVNTQLRIVHREDQCGVLAAAMHKAILAALHDVCLHTLMKNSTFATCPRETRCGTCIGTVAVLKILKVAIPSWCARAATFGMRLKVLKLLYFHDLNVVLGCRKSNAAILIMVNGMVLLQWPILGNPRCAYKGSRPRDLRKSQQASNRVSSSKQVPPVCDSERALMLVQSCSSSEECQVRMVILHRLLQQESVVEEQYVCLTGIPHSHSSLHNTVHSVCSSHQGIGGSFRCLFSKHLM